MAMKSGCEQHGEPKRYTYREYVDQFSNRSNDDRRERTLEEEVDILAKETVETFRSLLHEQQNSPPK